MIYLLRLLVAGLLMLVGSVLIERYVKPRLRTTASVGVALLAVVAGDVADALVARITEPNVVTTTTRKDGQLKLSVETDGPVESIRIDYQIAGHLHDFENDNPITLVHTDAWITGRQDEHGLENGLQLVLTRVAPNKRLNYSVRHTPSSIFPTLSFMGSDRYMVTYEWWHGRELRRKSEWRSVKNDRPMPPPPGRVSRITFSRNPRANDHTIAPKRPVGDNRGR